MKRKWMLPGTDLALEMTEQMMEPEEGIEMHIRYNDTKEIKETWIKIKNEQGAASVGKGCGNYITLEGVDLSAPDESYHKDLSAFLAERLQVLLKGKEHILVVGLGNQKITADSLGPAVVDNLRVTGHLVREGLMNKSKTITAFVPGVMAQTGVETGELLRGVISVIQPDVVVAVDALAARNVKRLNKTIQITDTGIAPGSGVGNHRMTLTKETMGVEVIGLGVPTVISVPRLVTDAFASVCEEEESEDEDISFLSQWAGMFVTPKNVDEAVKKISYTISEAINHMAF